MQSEKLMEIGSLLRSNAPERMDAMDKIRDADFQINDEITELLINCLEHKDPVVQAGAAEALLQSGREDALNSVLDYFQTCTWDNVRVQICRIIGHADIMRAAPVMLRATAARKGRVAVAAVKTLGALRCRYAVERLVELLEEEISHGMRRAVLTALGHIGDPGSVQALGAALRDDNQDSRLLAASGLGELCRRESIPVLVDELEHTDNNRMIGVILSALAVIKPDMEAPERFHDLLKHDDAQIRNQVRGLIMALSAPMNIDSLAEAAMDDRWEGAVPFARRLGLFDDDMVCKAIWNIYQKRPDDAAKIMNLIAESGCASAISLLKDIVSARPELALKAAEVLAGIPGPESLSMLEYLRESKVMTTMEPYVWALGAHGEKALPALIELLPGSSDSVAVETIKTIVSAHNKHFLPDDMLERCSNALESLLQEDRPRVTKAGLPDVRARCAWAFGALGLKEKVEVLNKLFRNRNEGLQTRRWACWSMGVLGSVDVKSIVEGFQKEELLMQLEILYAIGTARSSESFDFLRELMSKGHNMSVRLQALWALGRLAAEGVPPDPVIAVLTGGDRRMRARALEALSEFKDDKAARALMLVAADNKDEPEMRLDALAMAIDIADPDPSIMAEIADDQSLKNRLLNATAEEKVRWEGVITILSHAAMADVEESAEDNNREIWVRIEERLFEAVPVFNELTKDTHKALRAAEFYYDNSRLKVEGVDVSAIGFQYSKAIEVELAQHLVPHIKEAFRHEDFHSVFNIITYQDQSNRSLRVNAAFFNYLQTREHVKALFKDDLMENERFPKRKMAEILRQIQKNGTSVVIHGMKTIALLLLCFAMEHEYYDTSRYKDIKLPRLIPVHDDTEPELLKLIMNLIVLQNHRNRLVHHSVMDLGVSGVLTDRGLSEIRNLVLSSFALIHKVFQTD